MTGIYHLFYPFYFSTAENKRVLRASLHEVLLPWPKIPLHEKCCYNFVPIETGCGSANAIQAPPYLLSVQVSSPCFAMLALLGSKSTYSQFILLKQ